MTQPTKTLWDRFLAAAIGPLLDREAMQRQYDAIAWDTEVARLSEPQLIYPEYYRHNFHGIEGGYLTIDAAVTYDPITQYVLLPSETWIREDALKGIAGKPRRILDLACGTGTLTCMLKAAFPDAVVTGLDLSPYMLALAASKARQENLEIGWYHGLAERTGLPAVSFDLITASLLFHETPPAISRAVLQEAHRLLAPNGQFLALDGNQITLRIVPWLTEVFEEPYIKAYAGENLDAWLDKAGFAKICTVPIWGVHQVSYGFKALPATNQPSLTSMAADAATPVPV